MKFLCIGYYNAAKMDALPQDDIGELMDECRPHLEALYDCGRLVVDTGLRPETMSLHWRKGKVHAKAGRFGRGSEAIGSVFVIEAEDMVEAEQVARLHPSTQIGRGEDFGWRLEIRPVHHFHAQAGG